MSTQAQASPRSSVVIAYGVLTAIGTAFFALSFNYPWTSPDGSIGAAALPRSASALLIVLGLILVRQELRGGSVREGDGLVAEEPAHTPEDTRALRRKLITVFAAMVVTALLTPFLGLLLALTLLTLFLAAVVEKQPLVRSLLVAAGTFVVAYLIFVVLLQVSLPFGLLDPDVWSAL